MEPVKLAVGEAAIVEAPTSIILCLTSGSAEIAGRSLAANEPCIFPSARRGVMVYSLDGGVVAVSFPASESAATAAQQQQSLVRVTRFPAQIPSLLPIARSISKLPYGSRVVVFGRRGQGKSLAAHTLVNMLFRDSVTERRDAFEHVTLVCGDASSTGCADSVAPGCVSAVRVTRPGLSFATPFFHEMHVTFFRAADPQYVQQQPQQQQSGGGGGGGDDTAADAVLFGPEAATQSAHWLSQAVECSSSALAAGQTITIVDAEAPPPTQQQQQQGNNNSETHYTNVIDAVDPALVVFVGGENRRADPDCAVIESILRRAAGGGANIVGANLVHVPSLVPMGQQQQQQQQSALSPQQRQLLVNDKIDLYFCGSPELPLKCAKIVVPLNKVHFLGVSRGNSPHFRVSRIEPKRHLLEGRICAVSLAAVESEAAYANVAGLVLIASIDTDENEAVLYSPIGGDGAESTSLVRQFLLVGDNALRYSGSAVEASSI